MFQFKYLALGIPASNVRLKGQTLAFIARGIENKYLIKDISIGRGLQFRSRIVRWPIKDLAVALWCTHTLGYYWVHKLLMNEVILFNGKYITNFLEKKIMYFIRYTEKSYKRYFVLLFGWYFKLM